METVLSRTAAPAFGTTAAARPVALRGTGPGEALGNRRLLNALVAGLGLLAAALLSGRFDAGLPKLTQAEAATPMVAAASTPPRPSTPRLCFHGAGGELLDFAPAEGRCP